MASTKILADLIIIFIFLFYFVGSIYLIKKYDGFRRFYNGLNKLFTYKGRANRIEYACIALLMVSIYIIIEGLFSLLKDPPVIFLYIINSIFMFARFSVTARRLHDLGYSGWLPIPMVIVNIYTDVNFLAERNNYVGLIILLLISFSFHLFLIFKEGQDATNQYGEKPIDASN